MCTEGGLGAIARGRSMHVRMTSMISLVSASDDMLDYRANDCSISNGFWQSIKGSVGSEELGKWVMIELIYKALHMSLTLGFFFKLLLPFCSISLSLQSISQMSLINHLSHHGLPARPITDAKGLQCLNLTSIYLQPLPRKLSSPFSATVSSHC